MKILFIHNKYKQFGGEDVAVDLETSTLIKKGHEVKTLFFDNAPIGGSLSKITAAFRSIYNLASAKKVSKAILEFKPDIIHLHNLFFIASPSVIYAANKHNIPIILTLHNYRLICSNGLLLRDNRVCELCVQKKFPISGIKYKCYRGSSTGTAVVTAITGTHKLIGTWKNRVSAFIVSNEFSKSRFLNSSLDVPADRIIVKPNFVADPGEGNINRDNFFLFAGRIATEKGVDILLEAFVGLPSEKLIVIGDGPEKDLLQKKYSSQTNILFAGKKSRDEVLDAMKRSKAFICPSIWYEFTPFTNFEAFATGTPVIASRLGSMIDTVRDGYDGLHFNVGDANDLRQKIELFVQKVKNNNDYYKNARQTYLEKYHPEVYYRSILKIYETAVAGNYV